MTVCDYWCSECARQFSVEIDEYEDLLDCCPSCAGPLTEFYEDLQRLYDYAATVINA